MRTQQIEILKKSILSIILFSALPLGIFSPGFSQNLYPKKDLVFSQVIAGPGFDSCITVTNRGTYNYEGTLLFTTDADGVEWNPIVKRDTDEVASRTSDGKMEITLPPDQTRMIYIKESELTVGYAVFLSVDWSVDNHLEGNLTFFSYDGSGIQDAVGVPESREFYLASLPYNNFYDVGLSLVHPDVYELGTAQVRILLFNKAGEILTSCDLQLESFGQLALYLRELPWETPIQELDPLTIGKVEIESSVAISGIAFTITDGPAKRAEISTLPISPTPLTYSVNMEAENGDLYEGEISLWIEGYFVKGYLQFTGVNGEYFEYPYDYQPMLVSGELIDANLNLSFFCYWWPDASNGGVSLFINLPAFFPSTREMTGTWSADYVQEQNRNPLRGEIGLTNTMIAE